MFSDGDREQWFFAGRDVDPDGTEWLRWNPTRGMAVRGYTPYCIHADLFWERGKTLDD